MQNYLSWWETSRIDPGERSPHVPHLLIAHGHPFSFGATLCSKVDHQHAVARPSIDRGGLEYVPVGLVALYAGASTTAWEGSSPGTHQPASSSPSVLWMLTSR